MIGVTVAGWPPVFCRWTRITSCRGDTPLATFSSGITKARCVISTSPPRHRVRQQLEAVLHGELEPAGLRLPILRETRMPAVWCRIGPAPLVVERAAAVTAALSDAVTAWCRQPIDEPSSTP